MEAKTQIYPPNEKSSRNNIKARMNMILSSMPQRKRKEKKGKERKGKERKGKERRDQAYIIY